VPEILDTILLLALPASGKSEVRRFLASLTPEQCRADMCMGPTLQLDDYPYVHFMHRIDDELVARRWPAVFYKGPQRPFLDNFTWGVLVELLNDDFDDLVAGRTAQAPSAAQHLFDRLDDARARVGQPRALELVPYGIRRDVAAALEHEVAQFVREKDATAREDKRGRTIVIEAARGGPNGAAFPLTPPQGYQYSLSRFSDAVLQRASVLYVWVTPEQSRQKNWERARPDGQSSILHHGVPLEVMLSEYGCDDMDWLMQQSDEPGTIRVEKIVERADAQGRPAYELCTYRLPVARFDNRSDLTTFVRKDRGAWSAQEVEALRAGLSGALKSLARRMQARAGAGRPV
jgi:hypothetical protein